MKKRLGEEETQKLLDSGVIPFEAVNPEDDPEFAEVIHEYEASVFNWDEKAPDFNKAYGIVTISQDQPSLKRINWDIHWLNADGGEEKFERNFWLHETSMYWEQYGLRDFSFLAAPGEGE
jgi:ubiquinol-cytochrome c reductase cytochrome b subunit